MTAVLSPAQQAVVTTALALVGRVPEDQGPNNSSTNRWFQQQFGWGIGQPWCAMNVDRIGSTAGVLAKADMSAGAWALNEHLAGLPGGRLAKPEVGCTIAYNWGTGHIGVVVRLDPDPNYAWTVEGNTGNGNPAEGDGCYLNRRYLPGQLHAAAPFARFPGVAHPTAAAPPAGAWPWRTGLVRLGPGGKVYAHRLFGGHADCAVWVPNPAALLTEQSRLRAAGHPTDIVQILPTAANTAQITALLNAHPQKWS